MVPTPDRARSGAIKQLHFITSVRGGTGRRASFRGWWEQVRAVVPMPKEVMEAYWLSQLGMPIEFRCDFKHIKTDGNTSDIKVGGVTCDMKQIKSASVKKMKRRITEKIPRQGPVFMVDISESPMTFNAAEAALSQLLDDPCIERIYLTNGKRIEELKK